MSDESEPYAELVRLAKVVAQEKVPEDADREEKPQADQEHRLVSTRFWYLDRMNYDSYEWRRTQELWLTASGRFVVVTFTETWDPGRETTEEVRFASRDDLLLLDNTWARVPLLEGNTETGYQEGFEYGQPRQPQLYQGALRWLEGARTP